MWSETQMWKHIEGKILFSSFKEQNRENSIAAVDTAGLLQKQIAVAFKQLLANTLVVKQTMRKVCFHKKV